MESGKVAYYTIDPHSGPDPMWVGNPLHSLTFSLITTEYVNIHSITWKPSHYQLLKSL